MKNLLLILLTLGAGAVRAQTLPIGPVDDLTLPTGLPVETPLADPAAAIPIAPAAEAGEDSDVGDDDCSLLPEEYQAACYAALNGSPGEIASEATIAGTGVEAEASAEPETETEAGSEADFLRPKPHPKPGYKTSTISVTKTITISSCAPSVTKCPYTRKPLTTVTILTSTTICPDTTTTSSSSTRKCRWPHICTTTTTDCTTSSSTSSTSTSTSSSCSDDYPESTTTKTESCSNRRDCHHPTTSAPTSTYTQAGSGRREVVNGAVGMLAGFAAVLL